MNQIIKTPAADTAFATGAFAQSTVVPIDNEPLVMGVPRSKSPVRFRVSIDGQPPGPAHGLDVNERGNGTVVEQRLYQLIRQSKPTAIEHSRWNSSMQAWRRSLSRSADGDARP